MAGKTEVATDLPVPAAEGVVVVTGASGGVGAALTEMLATRGYPVVMACRNRDKAEKVRQGIIARTGSRTMTVRELDLASLASVERFAAEMAADGIKVSVLVNNAGVMSGRFRLTADGLEEDTAVNYIGAVALTGALLPLMREGAQVVNTVSCTYRLGRRVESILTPEPKHFGRFTAYGRSKLALLLYTLESAGKLRERGIRINAVDPGIVDTGMLTMGRWFDPLADLLFRPWVKTPEQGAATALKLICSPEAAGVTGTLWRGGRMRNVPKWVSAHPSRSLLLQRTEEWLAANRRERDGLCDE